MHGARSVAPSASPLTTAPGPPHRRRTPRHDAPRLPRGLQPHPGQRRRRDPRHRPHVALDRPEARRARPPRPRGPPRRRRRERPMKFHHMTTSSPNGSPPSTSTRAPSAPAVTDTPSRMPCRTHHAQLTARDGPVTDRHRPGIHEHRHLEAVRHRQQPPTPQRRAPPRPPPAASRPAPATPTPTAPPRTPARAPRRPPPRTSGTWCSNRGSTSATADGSTTHSCAPCSTVVRGRRHLRVRDAPPGRHQVHLARTHQRHRAQRVAVLDLAAEQPRHRGQPAVRVRRHVHAPRGRHVVGPVVVDEAPGPDERALPGRQGAPHGHGPRTPERHLTGHDDLRHRRSSVHGTGRAVQGSPSPGG